MDPIMKLRRFCFLGSFHPVSVHLRGYVNVNEYLTPVEELIAEINDTDFLAFMVGILGETLIRRDEAIFVYATYLAYNTDDEEDQKNGKKGAQPQEAGDPQCQAEIDEQLKAKKEKDMRIEWRTSMRNAFPRLIDTDNDLFLFCKYSTLIRKVKKKKWYSRTVRRAIVSWYSRKTPDELNAMWASNRGLHGLTHKALIKLCHITDDMIGSPSVASNFFKTCTELLKSNSNQPSTSRARNRRYVNVGQQNLSASLANITTLTLAVAKLRTTKNKEHAVELINAFNLSLNQVPGHLLRFPGVMRAVSRSMSYLQILKYWRKMARWNHFGAIPTFMNKCTKRLRDIDEAKKYRIHPVHILMGLSDFTIGKIHKVSNEKKQQPQFKYLDAIYRTSFNWPRSSDGLRMHITVNLQNNYKQKKLKNQNFNYVHACASLCLGYFNREAHVDIFRWCQYRSQLIRFIFDNDVGYQYFIDTFNGINDKGNNQLLADPVRNALGRIQVYDVFLCIVPTAGRGNPGNKPDHLRELLDQYRREKNPKARFIILNLLKFRPSMTYSRHISENILEICGLDKHTTDTIHNFVTYRFD